MFLSCRPFVVMTTLSTESVDNVVITTKGLQDRNINILNGTTVENKGKLTKQIFESITWRHIYCMFTYIYSLLIEKVNFNFSKRIS